MHFAESLRNPRLWIASTLMDGHRVLRKVALPRWLGVLLCLLALRLAQVQSRDGTYRKAFSGCLFPSVFLIVGATWAITVFNRARPRLPG
jgi:hypothetical protein